MTLLLGKKDRKKVPCSAEGLPASWEQIHQVPVHPEAARIALAQPPVIQQPAGKQLQLVTQPRKGQQHGQGPHGVILSLGCHYLLGLGVPVLETLPEAQHDAAVLCVCLGPAPQQAVIKCGTIQARIRQLFSDLVMRGIQAA